MLSRRRYLGVAAATVGAAGCLTEDVTERPSAGRNDTDTEPGDSDRESAPLPGETTPVSQFQYDSRNTGVVATDVPQDSTVDWRTFVGSSEAGLAVADGRAVVASGGLTALEADGGDELWSTPIDGWLRAPPTLTPDTAYVTAWGPPATHGVAAVALEDGRNRWRALADIEPATAPTLADDTVYVGGSLNSELVVALDARTGEELWRTEVGEYATTPAVAGDTVYVGAGKTHAVVALETSDGDERWRTETDGRVFDAPTVVDDTVYVGTRSGTVYALDAETGDRQWDVAVDPDIGASLAATADAVYAPGSESLTALDRTGEVLWSSPVSDGAYAPTVASDAVVVADRRAVRCFDAADGTTRWRTDVRDRTEGDQEFSGIRSPPFVDDDGVYVVSFAGDVYALE